jgi:lysozyme
MTPREAINTPAGQKITVAALALAAAVVVHFEGVVPHVYRDPIGIKTACVGHVDSTLQMGETFTQTQCQEMLAGDLTTASSGVESCVDVPLSDGEFAAFTSFAFNVGVADFCRSSIPAKLKAGNHAAACATLSAYRFVGGKDCALPQYEHVCGGVVTRRAAERHLCEGT